MRQLRLLFTLLVLFTAAGAVQARSAVLVDPDPVAVPAGLSQEQVAKDIKRALIGRGWAVTAEQPGEIDATLNLRDHVARIKLAYDARQVRIAYVDSSNLEHRIKRGKPYIHSNYLGWIGFLVNDLSANLQVSSMGG